MTLTRTHSRVSGGHRSGAPSIHLVTFGCQMNKYDSLLVEGRFARRGYRIAGGIDEADVVLFNTCSVRDHAEERVYSWVGELKRAKERRPDLVIGVLGCMAQRVGQEVFRRAGHVDIVCGTRQIQNLPDLVEKLLERRAAPVPLPPESRRLLQIETDAEVAVDRRGEVYTGGLCGYLAVMRGCDLSCTFCVVPRVRGRVRSRPIAALVDEARWMVDGGARVVTLLGQTVDSYGEDLPVPGPGAPRLRGRRGRPSLADLLFALEGVAGLERIRLVTLHPSYVTPALAEAIRDCPKVDRFLPLPVQSGSDAVLGRMKRGYTTDRYRRRVEILREAVPDIELGSDWIVGFPGESEEDFARSEHLLAEIGFAQGYVFKYDPRPDTAAFEMRDDVPAEVKRERNARLLAAMERVALSRLERNIGRTVEVFVEAESSKRPGSLVGRTDHGLPVSFPGDPVSIGSMAKVAIAHVTAYGLSGTPSQKPA